MLSDVRSRLYDYLVSATGNYWHDLFLSVAGYSVSVRSRVPDPQPLRGGYTSRSVGVSACWTDFRPRLGPWMSEAAYRADLCRFDSLMDSYQLHDYAPEAALSDTVSSDSDAVSSDTDDSVLRFGLRPCGPWDADSDYSYEDIDYGTTS